MKKFTYYWHIHPDVLLEPLFEPLESMIAYIKKNEPKDSIKLRIKLMKPVKNELPKEFSKIAKEIYNTRLGLIKENIKNDKAFRRCALAVLKRRKGYDKSGNGIKRANERFYKSSKRLRIKIKKLRMVEKKYNSLLKKYLSQLKLLHEKECGCGYDFKRNTIFTKENGLFKKIIKNDQRN